MTAVDQAIEDALAAARAFEASRDLDDLARLLAAIEKLDLAQLREFNLRQLEIGGRSKEPRR